MATELNLSSEVRAHFRVEPARRTGRRNENARPKDRYFYRERFVRD